MPKLARRLRRSYGGVTPPVAFMPRYQRNFTHACADLIVGRFMGIVRVVCWVACVLGASELYTRVFFRLWRGKALEWWE